ncbi:MAG: hypothetical protein FVQ80_08445, partial [Planctomycetes bacterium]|nr:hypothetical protein [Planctomycetota bacterium]
MGKIRRMGKKMGERSLWVMFILILLGGVFSRTVLVQAAENSTKRQIVRQVAQDWINAGNEQYKRGFYTQAEKSFLFAMDYKEYLSAAERTKLNELLAKTKMALAQRTPILDTIKQANTLIGKGQIEQAGTLLQKVSESPYLTDVERSQVSQALEQLAMRTNYQEENVTELYNSSIALYRTGQLEKARKGFLKIAKSGLLEAPAGMTAEDYLAKIDDAQRAELLYSTQNRSFTKEQNVSIEEKELVFDETLTIMAKPEKINKEQMLAYDKPAPLDVQIETIGSDSYIDVIKRKRSIIQSHTKAVVNDAVAKAQDFVALGEYKEAKEVVELAERKVNDNQTHLGDEIYEQYTRVLSEFKNNISRGQQKQDVKLAQEKQLQAAKNQKIIKDQMQNDRAKRINELIQNSVAYMKQQRYEAALGQLESLLAIDPLNDHALIQKQMLEDTIGFRQQLEVEKETSKEKVDSFLDAEKAGIPFADEMRHPKNWREIIARPTRRVEGVLGTDPTNMAVMEQMDEVVELLELTPETTFQEAIEILKNSVDPPLSVFVNWRDLYDVAEIDQTTPINMDAISAIPLRSAMELLLDAISSDLAEIDYIVMDGIVTIATTESLPSKMEIEVYNVTQLVSAPADFFFNLQAGDAVGGGGGGGGRGGGG